MNKYLRLLQKYRLEIVSFFVGATVLSFELTASRIVAPYIGTTIYTWTSVIGVILAALAIGYTAGGYLADARKKNTDVVALLCLSAITIIVVNIAKDSVLDSISTSSLPLQWQALTVSMVLFSLPTFFMGAISPYLARLNISKLSSSGFSLARINAAGTLGSLAGTFLTGYLLFSLLGSRHILAWLSICLLLTSYFISVSFAFAARLFLLLIAVPMLLYAPTAALNNASVADDLDTAYSRVIISERMYQNRPIRVLQTDNTAWQSGIYMDGDKELVFDYTKTFSSVVAALPEAHRILVVGGGSYSFPEFIANKYPNADIDVVEIDPGLTVVAKEYFNFQQPANLHIINKDGRQFLNNNNQKYDIVFMDAFSSSTPPFQLMTKEAVTKIQTSLTAQGLVAVNIISGASGEKSKMAGAAAATYGSVFKNVDIYQVDANFPKILTQNLLIIAGSDKVTPRVNQSLELAGSKALHTNTGPATFGYTKILTDDFAPVELISAKSLGL